MFRLSPILVGLSVLPGLISAVIGLDDYNAIVLHEQFAAAAYCPGNSQPAGLSTDKITCRTGNCPLVQNVDQNLVYKFSGGKQYNTTGYVAVDRFHQLIVVAFRGTEDCPTPTTGNCLVGPESVVSGGTSPVSYCAGCAIGTGFLNAWNEVRGPVLNQVRLLVAANGGFRVLVTGHSLGGALSTIAGADLRNELKGTIVDITPFAAPRVVNEALAHNISSQDDGVTANRPRNRRVTKLGDGVNNLPTNLAPLLPGLPDYFHFEPSYLINLPGQVLPSALNIDIVPGIDTLVPTLPPFIGLLPNNAALEETVAVHSFYLTWISECFSNGVVSRSRLITELGLPVPSTEYRKRGLRFTT